MSPDLIISLIPALFIAIIALCCRIQFKTWLDPSAFFALVWSVFVIGPILFCPNFFVSPLAISWILGAVLSLLVGNVLGKHICHFKSLTRAVNIIKTPKYLSHSTLPLLISTIAGLTACALTLHDNNYSIRSIVDPTKLAYIARASASGRYTGAYTPPVYISLLIAVNYFGCVLGGSRFVLNKSQSSKVYFYMSYLPLVSLVLFGIIQNTKATILYGIVLLLSGMLSSAAYFNIKNYFLISPKRFIKFFSIISLLFFIFLWMQMSRYGFQTDIWIVINEKIKLSAFGHLGGFSIWFDSYKLEGQNLGLGMNTLKGITDLFGDTLQGERPVFEPKYLGGYYITNVDTVFSDFINDFGLAGSYVMLSILGICSGIIYCSVKKGVHIAIPFLGIFYSFCMWGFITSILNYSSILFAWLLYLSYIILYEKKIFR